nr:hypothetical protein [uncultured bacterium]
MQAISSVQPSTRCMRCSELTALAPKGCKVIAAPRVSNRIIRNGNFIKRVLVWD